MQPSNSSEHLGHVLAQMARHWETRHAASGSTEGPAAPGWTIALEREAGAAGTSIAREVGARLQWQVYDHELIELIAQDMGVRSHLLKYVDERRKNWLQESLETFLLTPDITETAYTRHLIESILALGTHGQCIIVGRGAPFILPPGQTLRVRIVGYPHDRIHRVQRMLGLSRTEAEHEMARLDQERIRFTKTHFLKDPTEPENYDLVLNSSRFSTTECAACIIDSLSQLQARVGKDSEK
jgi:Cytidylate kinase-like family